jgi:crotonobetainyl-CoA:carnitine CoA-transferase CaiB-like acyl-CoA transferase
LSDADAPPRAARDGLRYPAGYLALNRHERGIALDLTTEAGKPALCRLVGCADVLVEDGRLGTLERLGFGQEALHACNPSLVLCSISGFCRAGPYAGCGGNELIAQSTAGLMAIPCEALGRASVTCGAPLARDGCRLSFEGVARNAVEEIGRATHDRAVLRRDRFAARLAAKPAEDVA